MLHGQNESGYTVVSLIDDISGDVKEAFDNDLKDWVKPCLITPDDAVWDKATSSFIAQFTPASQARCIAYGSETVNKSNRIDNETHRAILISNELSIKPRKGWNFEFSGNKFSILKLFNHGDIATELVLQGVDSGLE